MINKSSNFLFISLIFLCSCKFQPNNDLKIVSIHARYINATTHTPFNLNCDDIANHQFHHDTLIKNDTPFFNKLILIVNSLEKERTNKTKTIDSRICCIIKYSNDDSTNLVLGGFHGTAINGKVVNDNLELNYLIKKKIKFYDCFFYDMLNCFAELQDSSKLKEVQNSISKKHYSYDLKNYNEGIEEDTTIYKIKGW